MSQKYKCCDTEFENLNDFKRHIRSRNWHRLNYSDLIRLKMKNETLYNIIRNPNILFALSNLITPIQDMGILYLPFTKQRTGLVLKRSIVGKLEGPKPDIDLIKYKFTSDNIVYELEFRVKKINEEYSELLVLCPMNVNIGLLGRLLPSEVLKTLQKMVTPQIVVEKVSKNLSAISV
ncbi:MAG: hypothetical protein QXY87_13420 [Saccharolobus sp.]|uniref:hypothetical protein n=2 Tax=Sulfolobaceae TaxID=118883 RepID=UPI001F10C1FE|nr:hypothetical protein [Saccharolobus shibatae]MCH4816652.1 hypothetical protein [Saccharolobus shibatae]